MAGNTPHITQLRKSRSAASWFQPSPPLPETPALRPPDASAACLKLYFMPFRIIPNCPAQPYHGTETTGFACPGLSTKSRYIGNWRKDVCFGRGIASSDFRPLSASGGFPSSTGGKITGTGESNIGTESYVTLRISLWPKNRSVDFFYNFGKYNFMAISRKLNADQVKLIRLVTPDPRSDVGISYNHYFKVPVIIY